MTSKAGTTKAAASKPDTDEQGTKLAQVNDPAKLTAKKIDEIAKDDGTNEPENAANADAAQHLKETRDEAKKPDDGGVGYFGGQGGGAGL